MSNENIVIKLNTKKIKDIIILLIDKLFIKQLIIRSNKIIKAELAKIGNPNKTSKVNVEKMQIEKFFKFNFLLCKTEKKAIFIKENIIRSLTI